MDCGHRCCDIRKNCYHSHPVETDSCPFCEELRRREKERDERP